MSFDVPRINKWADNIESTLTEWAEEHICDWYDISSMEELTAEQVAEIEDFLMTAEDTWWNWVCIGFRNVINWWENEQYEEDDE